MSNDEKDARNEGVKADIKKEFQEQGKLLMNQCLNHAKDSTADLMQYSVKRVFDELITWLNDKLSA